MHCCTMPLNVYLQFDNLFTILLKLHFICIAYLYRSRWAGNVARLERGKPTGKRPLGRPRRRWEDNIRMDLEEMGVNVGNWVDSAQDSNYWRALVNAALNLRVP